MEYMSRVFWRLLLFGEKVHAIGKVGKISTINLEERINYLDMQSPLINKKK